jgi:hypothetical protein
MLYTASSESVSEGEGDDIPALSDDQGGTAETNKEIPLSTESTSADHWTLSKGTWSDKRERVKELHHS